MSTETIYVLPGMGADSEMYSGVWRTLPNCFFIKWPPYKNENSIEKISQRVAEEAEIKDGAILVGSSLGGIVACEIAKLRNLSHLFLVGGAKKKEEINDFLALIHPLADLLPIEFIQMVAGKIPNEVTKMFNRSQAEFIRAMCQAIFEWPGLDDAVFKPARIHGRFDRVIPVPPDAGKIVDGGHLIAMTHRQECVDFITSRIGR
ncbi:MAG TPA: alpha/beta hydrolase, partial [Opitutaceae bacterium]|nr:alpha/beta hydrolase [Opitutaceae bacterium]